jgi:cytochrome c biogenesis protein CcmG, thiol:disulfide interchange protein DsbE
VIIIAAIAAIASRSGDSGSSATPAGATVVPRTGLVNGTATVQGTPLPTQAQAGGQDPAVGMKAPTVTAQQFDGSSITFPTPGQPAVLMFLAHWCPHCQEEVPVITDHLSEVGLPNGVNLYAVSTAASEQRGNFPPASWLSKEGWPVPTAVDTQDQQIYNAYGVSGFPYFVAVDAQGNVVARTSGELTPQQFDALVQQARGGGSAAK